MWAGPDHSGDGKGGGLCRGLPSQVSRAWSGDFCNSAGVPLLVARHDVTSPAKAETIGKSMAEGVGTSTATLKRLKIKALQSWDTSSVYASGVPFWQAERHSPEP